MNVVILLFLCLRAEMISLGTINAGMGISIERPERSDIVSLELTFLKPGTGVTNLVTMVTTNRLIEAKDIPSQVQDGHVVLAFRWMLLGGLKSDYRLASMDLYRGVPEPPIVKQTFVSLDETGRIARQRAVNGLKDAQKDGLNIVAAEQYQSRSILTNDTPVRAWHGAMIDPRLAEAIREHFQAQAQPLPPLPPATNGMQRAFRGETISVREIQQKAQAEMLEFYRHGQKAR